MTALTWDKVGSRRYELGVDRGVLYFLDGSAVAWNGLTGLTPNLAREIKPYYLDGIKYLDHNVPGDFSATLTAFTYPDELDSLLGNDEYVAGVSLYDQRAKPFNLSYRTKIGNDLDPDAGYKIHILWNLLAVSSDTAFVSVSNSIAPMTFSWALTATPSQMIGARPTAHISLNSLQIDPDVLTDLEAVLYGTDTTDPDLPPLIDFLNLIPVA